MSPGDLDRVRALVRRHTPLAAEAVEPLGAGTESVAYRVDGGWVARFPCVAAARASLESELALAPLLAAALPVAVPRFEHVGRDGDGTAVMAAYRLLRGAAGARLRPHQGFGHPGQRELHRRQCGRLGAADTARVEALWQGFDAAALPLLAHADLKPEHVLHDPRTGRLTGVLDWGDACLSHPDFDLAVVGLFFDPALRDALAARLPTAEPRRVATHAGLLVAVRWLCDLDLAVRAGDEPFAALCAARLRAHLDAVD